MSGIEIALLLIGGIMFVISFFLPEGGKKRPMPEDARQISEDEIKSMIEKEMVDAREHVSEIVDETITYAMEKSERSMDRITNEKMLAINEYSDTVLNEINKNHQEVIFIYDMLNDKHETLKNTVSEAAITVSEVKQTVRDVEVTAKEAVKIAMSSAAIEDTDIEEEEEKTDFHPMQPIRIEMPAEERKSSRGSGKKKAAVDNLSDSKADIAEVDIHFKGNGTGGRNSNERILELHKAGKSNMAIAKDLGLGIGEVKLVIDLFEGAN